MDLNGLTPEGDLPPNHPLVLEALKGIISGPISELRTKVDNLIVNPSSTLKKGGIDYNNILPMANAPQKPQADVTSAIANNILNEIAPVQYMSNTPHQPTVIHKAPQQQVQQPVQTEVKPEDSDQFELPLYKKTDLEDLYKKMFDIEGKIDTLTKLCQKLLK